MLSKSEYLTAEEVIRRRHRRIMQLNRVYRDHYWKMMAELRRKYRDYMWNFGSPYIGGDGKLEGSNLGFRNGKGKVDAVEFIRCAHTNCSKKPMAMTKFCHAHILSDPKQVLYLYHFQKCIRSANCMCRTNTEIYCTFLLGVGNVKKPYTPPKEVHSQPVEKCWQPNDFLPDSSAEDFDEKVKELRLRAKELSDDYFVVLVGDMITEEALPTCQTMLNTLDGVRDETGASPTPWAVWNRAWPAEENRHGDLLNKYLYSIPHWASRHAPN
ncbi:hypothetical protein QQ045_022687 [Rhodiola kirilowii]